MPNDLDLYLSRHRFLLRELKDDYSESIQLILSDLLKQEKLSELKDLRLSIIYSFQKKAEYIVLRNREYLVFDQNLSELIHFFQKPLHMELDIKQLYVPVSELIATEFIGARHEQLAFVSTCYHLTCQFSSNYLGGRSPNSNESQLKATRITECFILAHELQHLIHRYSLNRNSQLEKVKALVAKELEQFFSHDSKSTTDRNEPSLAVRQFEIAKDIDTSDIDEEEIRASIMGNEFYLEEIACDIGALRNTVRLGITLRWSNRCDQSS